jgi:group I intron endonuclease
LADYVYCLEFPNGKRYVGIASNVDARWRSHQHCAKRGLKSALYSAMRKYGTKGIIRSVLGSGTRAEVAQMEREFIASMSTLCPGGYNIVPGGEDSPASVASVRRKIRASKLRHWQDPVYRAKALAFAKKTRFKKGFVPWNVGKEWSPESKAKMAAAKLGKKHTKKQRAARTASMLRQWADPERGVGARIAMTGRQWANDGAVNLQLRAGEPIPAGWIRGMVKRAKA